MALACSSLLSGCRALGMKPNGFYPHEDCTHYVYCDERDDRMHTNPCKTDDTQMFVTEGDHNGYCAP